MRLKRARSRRSDSVVEKLEEHKTDNDDGQIPIHEDIEEESKDDLNSLDASLRGSIRDSVTSGGRKSFIQGFTQR